MSANLATIHIEESDKTDFIKLYPDNEYPTQKEKFRALLTDYIGMLQEISSMSEQDNKEGAIHG